ncbi:MAG: NB-ARC domain-containing protein [Chloroflexi bacterium]|nr:NB-ARC domain-containing protein [Chloroflexota bacterium]
MALDKGRMGYWLSLWASRGSIPGSALAEQLGRHRSQATHWLRGERRLTPTDLCSLLLYLWRKGALSEPGEVRYALRQIGLPLDRLPDILAETPAEAKARAQFLAWLNDWQALALDLARQKIWWPPAYVERPSETSQLVTALLAKPPQPVIAWGMGGTGKTTLVNGVARLPAVRECFWNGVLWATLGPAPDWPAVLTGWCGLLRLPTNNADAAQLVRRLVAHLGAPGRGYLLVLDDVWTVEDIAPLQELTQVAGVLITTRQRGLAVLWPGSTPVEVGAFDETEALTVLRTHSASPGVAEPPGAGEELVRTVEGLPLAVALLGQAVGLYGWATVLERARDVERRLGVLHRDNDRYSSARLALQVSYNSLDAEAQARFRRLGVFPYGASFAAPVVAGLWRLADDAQPVQQWLDESRDRLADLADCGLLLIADDDAQAPRWRLHSVVHDYARHLLRQAGEWDAARADFVGHYLGLAHMLGQRPDQYDAQLTAEWPNLAGAFDYAWDAGRHETCAFLLACLHSWLLLTGRLAALDRWLARLAEVAEELSDAARGWLDHARTRRALALGQWAEAARYRDAVMSNDAVETRLKAFLCFEAIAPSLQWGDLEGAVRAFALGKGWAEALDDADVDIALCKAGAQLALAQHDWGTADRQIALAAATAREHNRTAEILDLLRWLGARYRAMGQPTEALTCFQAAWEVVQQGGALVLELSILVELAPLAATQGELGQVRAAADRLLAILPALELPEADKASREGFAYQLLAFVAQREGRMDDALALAQQAVERCRDARDPSMQGDAWRVLGAVHEARGEREGAITAYTAARAAYQQAHAAVQAQDVRTALARLAAWPLIFALL